MNEIVCICGSIRFKDEIGQARAELTLAGQIVLGPEILARSDQAYSELLNSETKNMLNQLHLKKIDLAGWVYVVDPGGYIGDSTRAEIAYAKRTGKEVRYLVPLPHEQ